MKNHHKENITGIPVPARNESELVTMFISLLFLDPSDGKISWDRPEYFAIKDSNKELFYTSGIIHRIFRRWLQTTWGWETWSKNFTGYTPRQELACIDPQISVGTKIVNIEFSKINNLYKAQPLIFPDGKNPNYFMRNVAAALTPRLSNVLENLDFDFHNFFTWLLDLEKDQTKLNVPLPQDAREKYFKLFWQQAGTNILLDCELEMPKSKQLALGAVFHEILNSYIKEQGKNVDDFLITDELFRRFWKVLRNADPRLLPMELIAEDKEFFDREINKKKPDKNFIYSEKIFYLLGIMFDRNFLFPLDLYFGACEVMWQDTENFIGCMTAALGLINGDLEANKATILKNDPLEAVDRFGLDLKQLWFVPPSYFRLFPWAREILVK